MAAAAKARRQERYRLDQARRVAGEAEYKRQLAESQHAEFEAGPPGGCRDCYVRALSPVTGRFYWRHVTISEGDCTCYHSCHSEPEPCPPVVYG